MVCKVHHRGNFGKFPGYFRSIFRNLPKIYDEALLGKQLLANTLAIIGFLNGCKYNFALAFHHNSERLSLSA